MTKPDRGKAASREKNMRRDVPQVVSLTHEFATGKTFVYAATVDFIMKDIKIYYRLEPPKISTNVPATRNELTVRIAIGKDGAKAAIAFEFDVVPGLNSFNDKVEVKANDLVMVRCEQILPEGGSVGLSFNKAIKL